MGDVYSIGRRKSSLQPSVVIRECQILKNVKEILYRLLFKKTSGSILNIIP